MPGGPVGPHGSDYIIKDSGSRAEFDGGMVRDTTEGKVDYTNVHYGPMLNRWAAHLSKGREKYADPEPGIPNWTLGRGIDVWLRARESFRRHQEQWLAGAVDEDHASAMFFNINLKEYVQRFLTGEELALTRRIESLHGEIHDVGPAIYKAPCSLGGECDGSCFSDAAGCDLNPAPFTDTSVAALTAGDVIAGMEGPTEVEPDPRPSPAAEGCGGNCDSPFADPPLEELEKGLNPFKKRCCGPKYVSDEAIKAGSLWCPHCSSLLLRGAATWDCPTHGPILNHEDVK